MAVNYDVIARKLEWNDKYEEWVEVKEEPAEYVGFDDLDHVFEWLVAYYEADNPEAYYGADDREKFRENIKFIENPDELGIYRDWEDGEHYYLEVRKVDEEE